MSKAFGSPRCPHWLRSGFSRPSNSVGEANMASQATAGKSKEADPQIALGPEALKMKAMGESMQLEPFEVAQLMAQGHKIDLEIRMKELELNQAQRERETFIKREDDKWQQILARDLHERESLRESLAQQRPPRNFLADSFRVKLEPFNDKDDIDEFLSHFETVAHANSWPKEIWAIRVLPLLQGSAREAVKNMSSSEVKEYDSLKKALLFRFRKTPEHFRETFRQYSRKDSETFVQAGEKMSNLCKKWVTLSGKDPKNPEDLWNAFMMEQAYQLIGGGELEVKVREREPSSFQSVLEIADIVSEAERSSQEFREGDSCLV